MNLGALAHDALYGSCSHVVDVPALCALAAPQSHMSSSCVLLSALQAQNERLQLQAEIAAVENELEQQQQLNASMQQAVNKQNKANAAGKRLKDEKELRDHNANARWLARKTDKQQRQAAAWKASDKSALLEVRQHQCEL